MSGDQLVGRGLHATVWRSPDGQTVRKRYLPDAGTDPRELAERERETLLSAASLLSSIPGLRVPQPYTVDNPDELIMEYCPGVPLHAALEHPQFGERRIVRAVADDLANALFILARRLAPSDFDLSPRNTLYDAGHDQLILIDFTPRTLAVPHPDEVDPVDFALASFLAAALTAPLHRENASRLSASRRLITLSRELVRSLESWHEVDRPAVEHLAWRHFKHRSRNAGLPRKLWFGSVGRLLFGYMLGVVLTSREKSTTLE